MYICICKVLASMASLAAAASVKMKDVDVSLEAAGKKLKNRVVVDPLATANELANVIHDFLQCKKTKDLWALLAPCPGGRSHTAGILPFMTRVGWQKQFVRFSIS